MFHKEGGKIILISTTITVILLLLADRFIPMLWLQKTVELFVLFFLIMILQFFRNPSRFTDNSDTHIIAPVDGKVVVIEEVFEAEHFNDKRLQISIFMSPINVHVTRYPVNGKVKYSKYHPGKYLVAWHPKSSTENERTTVVIENRIFGEILYRQVAGALAKRIVNYAKEGMQVVQGNDAGFIKFGSRVDLYLPLGTKVDVKLNQKALVEKLLSPLNLMKDRDLDTRFKEAFNIGSAMSQSELPQDVQLRLYAFYKQATAGTPAANLNSGFDLRNAFKTNAWMQISHMSADEAKESYIDLIQSLNNNSKI